MNRFMVITVALAVSMGTGAAAMGNPGDTWILGYTLQGGGWHHETGGNYDNTDYDWAEGWSSERVGYWLFDDANVLSPGSPPIPWETKLYLVEQWVPSTLPTGVAGWEWLQIEVTFSPGGGTGEAGTTNYDIPWEGTNRMNHQWLAMPQDGTQVDFQQAGPGPHAPEDEMCQAGTNGSYVYLKQGSTLYSPWSLETGPTHAMTALRITDPGAPPPEGCDWGVPVVEGALDLRQVGNADPLYYADEFGGTGETFYNTIQKMVREGDSTLAAEGYKRHLGSEPLTPGLPPVGLYTAHLDPADPAGDVEFLLRYIGLNTIKWRTDHTAGTFSRYNVFTLNQVAGQEFEEGNYDKLYFLSTKSGSQGMLHVEAIYSDEPPDTFSAQLYDWFGQDGDQDSMAVGVGGHLRSEGWPIGFKRLNTDGGPDGGGDHGGAFLFVHPVDVNEDRVLTQVRLSIGPDANGLNGSMCIFAATFVEGFPCNDPVFDADGDTDVDQDDFGRFQACFTGSSPPPGVFDWEKCGCFDVVEDQAIDDDDYAYFEECASGPAIPVADPDCDNPPAP